MKVTTRKGKAFLSVNGELTVALAADFQNALLKSLNEADIIEVNLDKVTRIDLSCLQLLCSAHRSAAKQGKTLSVKDASMPFYLEARKNAGFMYSKPCKHATTDDCLWVGGNE